MATTIQLTLPSVPKRVWITGAVISVLYIALTWTLYHSWVDDMMSISQRSGVGQGTLSYSQMEGVYAEALASKPFLLKFLMYPVQTAATNTAGGVLPFWSVLLQGLWLGGGIVAFTLWPTNLTFIVLSLLPVFHFLLIGETGGFLGAFIVGLPFGLMVNALMWWISRAVAIRSKPLPTPAP